MPAAGCPRMAWQRRLPAIAPNRTESHPITRSEPAMGAIERESRLLKENQGNSRCRFFPAPLPRSATGRGRLRGKLEEDGGLEKRAPDTFRQVSIQSNRGQSCLIERSEKPREARPQGWRRRSPAIVPQIFHAHCRSPFLLRSTLDIPNCAHYEFPGSSPPRRPLFSPQHPEPLSR